MNMFEQQHSARSVSFRAPGLLTQILAIIIFLAIVAALFFILIPLALVLLVVGLAYFAYFKIKLAFRRAHEPNGPLDGRRNVRVVERDE
jgi:ABC-type bacteriocin/lantibiotic exporter with double-glycine peptidase domain